jgi:DNA-binding transcriptional MocR family regulator
MSKFEYLKLADTVAAEIANGALKPGDRLPPQRSFAYQRKIAVSTASRVYTELLRRGLVIGEVGRGTFVSGETRRGGNLTLAEPRGVRIDLEVNYPLLPTQSAMIARSLEGLERPGRSILRYARRPASARRQRERSPQNSSPARTGLPTPIRWSSPRTEGNALLRRLPRQCRTEAAAGSRR